MSRSTQDYIGSYRLLNLLRMGKTCQVWEVINDTKGERFAIKLLLPEYRHNKEEVAFLRHEHEVGRKLKHPRVIQIYEFGAERDSIFLAMELFPTPNVKQLIQTQGVELIAPLLDKFVEQAADGLAYFHNQGWVHRDVKPDNFLMNATGDVKLIDFALAVRQRRGLGRLFGGKAKRIQGTRSYMSPEQIRGQALDQRADIYSFGCMLHELLTGKPPFTGTSTNDLLNKHLRSAPPPVQSVNRNVTDSFAELVRRMLAKKPEERPASLEDVSREVRAAAIFKMPPASFKR